MCAKSEISIQVLKEMESMSKGKQSDEEHHGELAKRLYEQMKEIPESSEQPMSTYLEDNQRARALPSKSFFSEFHILS